MADIYQEVTDRIVAKLEQGEIPWHKDWSSTFGYAVKYRDSSAYSLLNQLLLDDPGEYISFAECKKLGGNVKKGAKGKAVVFWSFIDKKDEDGKIVMGENGKPEQIPFLKRYVVFHLNDCEGLKSKLPEQKLNEDIKSIDKAEEAIKTYISASGVKFENVQQNRAYYNPSSDTVVLPIMKQFETAEGYYATALHECIHSTGHEKRLNRLAQGATFGSQSYSAEELVAEIGSAMLCSILGIETERTFDNSAAYVQGWLKALKNDKRLIVSAAGKAEKAVRLFLGQN